MKESATKIFKNSNNEILKELLPCSLAGAFGILTNSVCTIFMMWVFNAAEIALVFSVIISVNFIAEILGAIILAPIYVKVFKRVNSRL